MTTKQFFGSIAISLFAAASASAQTLVPSPRPVPEASIRFPRALPYERIDLAIERAEEALGRFELQRLPAPPAAPAAPAPPAPPALRGRGGQAEALYDQGRDLIEMGRYQLAVGQFDRLIEMKAKTADAAFYWKAYSLGRLGEQSKALTALGDLQKQYADSRWIKDAKALELELRQASGQAISPDAQNNEELKLLALRGLMQNDPDQALPIVERMLNGGDTPRVKEQALFVLSQTRSPRAKDIIAGVAKGSANPDLQMRAIRYLGIMRASPELLAAYQADSSTDTRKSIANALFIARDAAGLVTLARAERNPEMKRELVSKLSLMKSKEATDYLLELLK
jgi:hypothetical protein